MSIHNLINTSEVYFKNELRYSLLLKEKERQFSSKKNILNSLITTNKLRSLNTWFVDNSLWKTKKHLSTIGLLYHFLNNPNLETWGSNVDLGYIFCSDNQKVIDACVSLQQSRNFNVDGGGLPWRGNAVANAYSENWENLEEDCFYLDKSFGKEYGVDFIIEFYHSLMKEDEMKMEVALNTLSTKKYWSKTQIKTDLIPQFILMPTLTFVKLAWMKGYEIELDSQYIPNEWLPIQPLESYEIPYDFLTQHCLEYNLL